MATQVARTILERAAEWGRLRVSRVRAAKERDRVRRADFRHALNMLKGAEKIALIDMDGTLLNGRFVLELAPKNQKDGAAKSPARQSHGGCEHSHEANCCYFQGNSKVHL